MKVIRDIPELKKIRSAMKGKVGFVPTMGFLHAGHASLVKRCKKENDTTVVSIFVNPTQFAPGEDYDRYPRDERRDASILEKAGADVVFIPSVQNMYPSGFNTWIETAGLTERLEGAVRPGHFRGVTTVCAKLFNIVSPDRAYFGQKDAQQAMVIKKMVADLNMNLEVVVIPTLREKDGLAMSSRNTYLNQDERKAAVVLYRSLQKAADIKKSGENDAGIIRSAMAEIIKQEPLARIDYISVADTVTLKELDEIRSRALVSLAVYIGDTRLIDNILL